jgi:hypothetical protein
MGPFNLAAIGPDSFGVALKTAIADMLQLFLVNLPQWIVSVPVSESGNSILLTFCAAADQTPLSAHLSNATMSLCSCSSQSQYSAG